MSVRQCFAQFGWDQALPNLGKDWVGFGFVLFGLVIRYMRDISTPSGPYDHYLKNRLHWIFMFLGLLFLCPFSS